VQAGQKSGQNHRAARTNVGQGVLPLYRQGDQSASIGEATNPTSRCEMDSTQPLRPSFPMHTTLTTLIDRLDSPAVSGTSVIRWGCPVPSFGDLSSSRVATLGLNPSNREFVDELGDELQGASRRFHTLASLGLASWEEVDARHLRLILESCCNYFLGNPYDRWFKRLDQVVAGAAASFYDASCKACHLDLIPYATVCKWTELTMRQRSSLLAVAADTLGLLLRDSPVRVLILNGRSVLELFQDVAGICLERQEMRAWSLDRRPKRDVMGLAYKGVVDALSGVQLPHQILVLGFNHNLQSSFGVTNEAIIAIRNWISRTVNETTA
jgi:hypothetical protein